MTPISNRIALSIAKSINTGIWDYYRQGFERDRGLKIDFVLGSPTLASRVTGAFIDRDERDPAQGTGAPSDHAPVVVDLSD